MRRAMKSATRSAAIYADAPDMKRSSIPLKAPETTPRQTEDRHGYNHIGFTTDHRGGRRLVGPGLQRMESAWAGRTAAYRPGLDENDTLPSQGERSHRDQPVSGQRPGRRQRRLSFKPSRAWRPSPAHRPLANSAPPAQSIHLDRF